MIAIPIIKTNEPIHKYIFRNNLSNAQIESSSPRAIGLYIQNTIAELNPNSDKFNTSNMDTNRPSKPAYCIPNIFIISVLIINGQTKVTILFTKPNAIFLTAFCVRFNFNNFSLLILSIHRGKTSQLYICIPNFIII